ncbi:MAG TPA: metallophosphoesterase [Bacteroidota bacterium]|nr:metallophosphoesterase [Bacteroidota bacterium]
MFYILWFIVAFAIVGSGYAYVGWRLIAPAHMAPPWNLISWCALAILLLLPVSAMVLEVNRIGASWKRDLEWAAYLSLGFFSLVITLLLVRDAAWLLGIGARKGAALLAAIAGRTAGTAGPADPGRRATLIQSVNLGLLAAAGALAGYGLFEARRRPSVPLVEIPVDGLPESLEGFRIVQITDLHAGLTIGRPFVETIVEMANGLDADILAFTGDMADGKVADLHGDVEPLGRLRARYGKYFITGNHEYYSGALPWIEEARRLGFDVLLNEHRLIRRGTGRLLLAGVTDVSGGQFIPEHRSDPHRAIAGAPEADVKVLLAHQPRSLYESRKEGFQVQISGHTHGGQFFPWNLLATVGQPSIRGLRRFQDTWLYVSKGTGYWGPPVRIGARSEIAVITLTGKKGGISSAS